MQGEDEAMIGELERFIAAKNAFVIIAPRKPERFEIVAAMLTAAKIRFVRRSDWSDGPADVLLLDTFGELSKIYRFATAAFVGGSLVPTGGHNPIEPAAVGVPVCFGPYMSNFREIAGVFLRDGGASRGEVRRRRLRLRVAHVRQRGRAARHERARARDGRTEPRRRGADRGTHPRVAGVTILLKPLELLWRGVNRVAPRALPARHPEEQAAAEAGDLGRQPRRRRRRQDAGGHRHRRATSKSAASAWPCSRAATAAPATRPASSRRSMPRRSATSRC